MATHRILYLSDSVLEDAELCETDNVVEAVKRASACSPDLAAEVWTDQGKVAVVRPSWAPPDRSPG